MGNQRTRTIRQEIMDCLKNDSMTIRDLSQAVGIMEKDVCHHLEYIEKTVRALNKRVHVAPYSCLDCGFKFRNRKKFKKPGKCPKCKEGRIAPAFFSIRP
ncbi:hypothetical protein [Desulfospira joergensenii]|uniref:hypothetical protein n=1 Tax=Desulfospira joergensenii TaxID=53329 RepID=UPI0003B79348|nr:hypothetical protein [Desulfospira joergensenii]